LGIDVHCDQASGLHPVGEPGVEAVRHVEVEAKAGDGGIEDRLHQRVLGVGLGPAEVDRSGLVGPLVNEVDAAAHDLDQAAVALGG